MDTGCRALKRPTSAFGPLWSSAAFGFRAEVWPPFWQVYRLLHRAICTPAVPTASNDIAIDLISGKIRYPFDSSNGLVAAIRNNSYPALEPPGNLLQL